MDDSLFRHIDHLIDRYPKLIVCREDIWRAYEILEETYSLDRKLLVSGNGGSASDSEHIVGELMKEFRQKRKVYAELIRSYLLEVCYPPGAGDSPSPGREAIYKALMA